MLVEPSDQASDEFSRPSRPNGDHYETTSSSHRSPRRCSQSPAHGNSDTAGTPPAGSAAPPPALGTRAERAGPTPPAVQRLTPQAAAPAAAAPAATDPAGGRGRGGRGNAILRRHRRRLRRDAGASQPIVSATAPNPDPRVGLPPAAGTPRRPRGTCRWFRRRPRAEKFLGVTNSDLAFTGKYAIQGNYNGFQVFDLSTPAKPVPVLTYVCPHRRATSRSSRTCCSSRVKA